MGNRPTGEVDDAEPGQEAAGLVVDEYRGDGEAPALGGHSQLAPCSFQYTSSTPPGFSTEVQSDSISVRNFSTTETENHRLAFKRHQLIIKRHCRSVGVERAPRTLPTRCSTVVPHSTVSLPVFPTAARHSPPPSSAARDATPTSGPGLSVVGGATPGRDTGKRSEVVAKSGARCRPFAGAARARRRLWPILLRAQHRVPYLLSIKPYRNP